MIGIAGLGPIFSNGNFNPKILNLTSWWRGSFTGAPWLGSSSAGNSSSHALATQGGDPTLGTALNGYTPALFVAGAAPPKQLADTTDSMSDLLTTTSYSICVLFNAVSQFTNTGTITDSPCFITDFSGVVGMAYDSTGVTFFHDDAVYRTITISAGINNWVFAQAYFNGSTIFLRTNSGNWSSRSAGTLVSINSDSIRSGTNWSAANFYDGNIMEIITSQQALSTANFDSIKSYINKRYNLSL